jgi:hypothetical protein
MHQKDPSLLEHVGERMRINGRGNAKHCADAATMVEILLLVPNNANTRAYRRRCSEIISRYQSGDESLKGEIDRNKAAADANGGLPQFRSVPSAPRCEVSTVHDEERRVRIRERTLVLDLASTPEGLRRRHAEEDRALAERTVAGQERLREQFVANVKSEMDLFNEYDALVGSDIILYKAAISNFNPSARLALAAPAPVPAPAPVDGAQAEGAPAEGEQQQQQQQHLPPPQDGTRMNEKGKYWDVGDVNGKMGDANVYSPHDIDTWIVQRLMELVAEKPNAGKPAPKTNKGPKTSKGTKRKKGCQW